MQKLHYTETIHAPKDKVWRIMLDDATYREWTTAFAEGSYAVTDWKPGSKALFLAHAGEGMVSRIAEHRPGEFLSIEHLGFVKNGQEDTTSEQVKLWAGAHENYSISEQEGVSTLRIELDCSDSYRKMMDEMWPKALAKLKAISER